MKLRSLLFFLMALPMMVWAQNTSSSINGFVKSAGGEPMVGASISAVHEPTGTVYRGQTRAGGRYEISNMNPGGPYVITVSFVNFETFKKEEVYLNLGESSKQDFTIGEKATQLTSVTVLANRSQVQGKGGTETSIGRDKVANLPNVGRNLQDFLRYTPQAKLTSADGAVSIAGQNNRYNGFYIDGAVNNDVFGLSNSGTNGGQAGASPISIDAIDQFQVIISPYDASIGNFTGGAINATTRSGTNTTQGSLYYFFRNQELAGKTPSGDKSRATRLNNFKNETTGFRIGGALIKNKLFYFINGEIQRDKRPQPFAASGYTGTSKEADINTLSNYLKTTYSYDPGTFGDNPDRLAAEKVAAKVDWNINDNNRLSLSYRFAKSERDNTSATTSTRINFFNNGFLIPNTTNSASAELKTNLGKGMSNRLLLTYTGVEDDRGPLGTPFPRVSILDGPGTLVFGTENFSAANLLKQTNFALLDFFKFNKGNNYFTVGTDNEFSKSYNVFIRDNYGTYVFPNLATFLANGRPTSFDRSFSLVDKTAGDVTDAAAKFNSLRLGLFANDEIRINENFTLNLGIRADYTKFLTTPRTDAFFNDTAINILSRSYDLQGARSGQIATPKVSLSPRVGFTYKIPEDDVTIRGGIGMFTGRIPLVWPGGVYNQNGVSVGGVSLSGGSVPANFVFNPNPLAQPTAADLGISTANAKGQVDLIAKDFRLPKLLRTSLAIDKRLGNGWTTTLEGIFSKNINEINYQNVNIIPPTLKATGPDNRNVYTTVSGNVPQIPLRFNGINPYQNGVYLLSNNKGDKGFSYTFTFTVDKAFKNGFAFNANYSYGNSVVTYEGTSSQNNSQWQNQETVNGRNFTGRSTSDFDLGHRINAYISKTFKWNQKGNFPTTFTLTYNGQSGAPFSYVYNQSLVSDFRRNAFADLVFVPTTQQIMGGEYIFVTNTAGGVTYTPAQQQVAFEKYITNDKYLSKRRGMYAERNASRLPFTNIVDLSVRQNINFRLAKRKYSFELRLDVSNFTNMLNRDWGRQYFLSFDTYNLVNFAGFQTGTTTPTYRFNPAIVGTTPYGLSASVAPNYTARWVSQLGIRFNF